MEEEKKPWTSEEIIKLSAIALIFIAMIVYSLLTGNSSSNKKDEQLIKVDPAKVFEPIDNNYELVIKKTINSKTETINYITDGTFKLYNIDDNKNGYLVYNGKTYYVEAKNYKIKEYNKKVDIINDNFYNIKFIKSIINKCEIEQLTNNEFNCSIDLIDYFNSYNTNFYTNYIYDGEDKIVFNIKYGNIVNSINIDYSKVSNVMKNNNDIVKYNIKIEKVNSNDYSNLLNVFGDTLKK